jgi:Outer membrane protein beta-barrel domain
MRRSHLGLFAAAGAFLLTHGANAQLAPPPPSSAPPGSPLQSGGLAPPPPNTGPTPPQPNQPNGTERRLQESDSSDSGRGLEFFYVTPELGIAYTSLSGLHSNGDLVAPSSGSSGTGALWGVGAGARLLFATVGPHFRMTNFKDKNVWSLGLDLGWHVPLGSFEPYGALGAGYARLSYTGSSPGGQDLTGSGFDVRLAGGFDYYVTHVFSAGANLTGELLKLSRSAIPASVATTGDADVYKRDASGLGISVSVTAVAGLHF